jgi:hypothetical protein
MMSTRHLSCGSFNYTPMPSAATRLGSCCGGMPARMPSRLMAQTVADVRAFITPLQDSVNATSAGVSTSNYVDVQGVEQIPR